MMKAWRLEHPPPGLSAPVRDLVEEQQAVFAAAHGGKAYLDLPPLEEDVLWNAVTFHEYLWTSSVCGICRGKGGPVYRLGCGHYVHVRCLEGSYEVWMGRRGRDEECSCCRSLKELLGGLQRLEVERMVSRLGEKLVPWRRPL